jgi:hypothetical protein
LVTTISTNTGYELAYNNNQSVIAGTTYSNPEYNGNIGGLIWKSAGDGTPRSYDFTYDAANRLTNADFNQFTNGYFNKIAGVDFSTNGLTYDVNGNILSMTQKGWKLNASSVVDKLTYTYQATSNKLANVADTSAASSLGDFADNNKVGDDYTYDVNGNMTADKNKAITSVLYTHLNTPYEVNITGKGKITYLYDNLGRRLKKTVIDNTTTPSKTTVWLYMDNFVYKDDTLQYFTHEEGRARFDIKIVYARMDAIARHDFKQLGCTYCACAFLDKLNIAAIGGAGAKTTRATDTARTHVDTRSRFIFPDGVLRVDLGAAHCPFIAECRVLRSIFFFR